MSNYRHLSRRGFLKGLGVAAGAAAGTRLGGPGWLGPAFAADGEKSALVSIFLSGGYNAIFPAPFAFKGKSFGVTDGNIKSLGNNVYVDAASLGSLDAFSLGHMASIGNRHGSSDHGNAQSLNFGEANRSYALQLAAAMGGTAAIKAASMGRLPPGPKAAESGVSYQQINDMGSTIKTLGGGDPDPKTPARNVASEAIARAGTMSSGSMGKNPNALVSFRDGYSTAVETLKKPVQPFSFPTLAQAYGQSTTDTAVKSFASKMVGAELMIRAGANLVTVTDDFSWDSHGDTSGNNVRNRMNQSIMPSLKTFLARLQSDPDLKAMNVVVMIHGDFSRSLPGSDHQPNLTATVIGKYVQVGSTGNTDANVALPPSTPGTKGMWAYVAKALKCPTEPFGPNPHALVL
ncbi:twin-arginine translocation signal domain-containing protein [Pendulispora albinea]|uniref:Twin-arginine translocation signal domain-containing protein n=1 Tax=Pendulispora albinea TaxID=2741071 RepID=A0ABZ2LT41_9BACT